MSSVTAGEALTRAWLQRSAMRSWQGQKCAMSANDDTVCLRHMLDAAKKSLEFIKDRKLEDLEADEMLQPPLVSSLEKMLR